MTTNSERTTLATIASEAGVSVATVSKVVNGRPHVSSTTRALIESLLHEHEYVARRADIVRFPSIELVFHLPLTAYSLEILHGVVVEGADRVRRHCGHLAAARLARSRCGFAAVGASARRRRSAGGDRRGQ